MRVYDVDAVGYRFWLLPPSGQRKDITDIIESAIFTSTSDGIVDTVNMRVKNFKVVGGWVHRDVYLAHRMMIEAKDENINWTEIYRGSFTSWQTSALTHTINSTASDTNQLLVGNDIIYYFPEGSIEGRVKKILSGIGMSVGKIEGMGTSLSKEMVKSQATSKILEYKKKAEEKTGVKTVIRNTKGKFEIAERGGNKEIYVLDSWGAGEGTDEHSIPADFATVVEVYGAVEGDDIPPLKTTLRGDTKFGTHTKIIYSSDYKSTGEANSAAKNILKDKGKPEKKQTIKDYVDVPWIRVGDAVDVIIGTIAGGKDDVAIPLRRYVVAISRNYVNKTMTLELEE